MEKFFRKLILISTVLLATGIALMFATGNSNLVLPFVIGWAVSFLNSVIGINVIARAFRSAGKSFFNTILLSMVVRMFAIVAVVGVLIVFLKIDKINLAVSLFLFYFLFLVLEIVFLQNEARKNEIVHNN